ncbi:NAD(P)-binding domain-containing protein [Azospirillum sp. Sh1]|uniref:NAD(P)-binding domain-containing protein n=1 Tax=Azospirillum sp. Sh1 TaxID=2607285 RepID=UPI0011F08573|nr:NAD(P)-binding domain-containing protein [Azospirillum sp. Sh1]KAA0571829.1 hypothetical protein FZ029_25630 [Azospirillum sp. Sh1]
MTTYAILGSGAIGAAVAGQFARKGIEVLLANRRGSATRSRCSRQTTLTGVLAVCESTARMGKAQTHERPGSFEPGRQVSVVAGAGFEPAAFRL